MTTSLKARWLIATFHNIHNSIRGVYHKTVVDQFFHQQEEEKEIGHQKGQKSWGDLGMGHKFETQFEVFKEIWGQFGISEHLGQIYN